MGQLEQATEPAPSPGAAARTLGGRRPHARTSPLFPISCLAAARLTLAAQDCGGYKGYFRGVVLPEREQPCDQRWTPKLGQLAKVGSRPRRRSLECHGRDGVILLS